MPDNYAQPDSFNPYNRIDDPQGMVYDGSEFGFRPGFGHGFHQFHHFHHHIHHYFFHHHPY